MTTGRAYAQKIDQAIAKLGRDHDAQSRQMDGLNREVATIRRDIAAAYLAIAKDHVVALDAKQIQAYDRITEEAAFRIGTRQEEIRALRAELARCLAAEEEDLAAQAQAIDVRDEAAEAIRSLEQLVDGFLEADQGFQELTTKAQVEQEVADSSNAKWLWALAESGQKTQAFQSDPIFMYLYQRRYGTQGYRRQTLRLVKLVDGWVARLCGYESASRDYQSLSVLPGYLEEHARKMRQAADAVVAQVHAVRHQALREAGVDPLLANFREANRQLGKKDADVEQARKMLDTAREHLHRVEEWRDEISANLLERMAAVFSSEGFDKLRSRVKNTATLDDDILLDRIQLWLGQVQDTQARIGEITTYIRAITDRTASLVQLRGQYRSKGYDSADYKLSGRRAEELLSGFVLGTVIGTDLWNSITASARYDPPYTPSRNATSSSGGGFSTGSSFGGSGSFRTGGGF